MRDVVEQLDRYQGYLDARFPDVTLAEVFDLVSRSVDETTVPQHVPRWRASLAFAAAFAAIILLGAVAYLAGLAVTRSSGPAVPPEPATTIPAWNPVPTDPPWGQVVVGAASLPDGRFVALTTDPMGVSWSPDGETWFDVDPGGDVVGFAPRWDGVGEPQIVPEVLAVAGDHVGVIDRENTQVWVGRPGYSGWRPVSLDTTLLEGQVDLMTIAGGVDEFLVVARTVGTSVLDVDDAASPLSIPSTEAYLAWVVDPATASATRKALPISVPEWTTHVNVAAEWIDGRWVVLVPRNVLAGPDAEWSSPADSFTSPDGIDWSATELPEDFSSVTSVAASDTVLIATVCDFGGDSFWYSTTGLNWTKATSDHLGHNSAYVEGLGFIVRYQDAWAVSPDGINWQRPGDRGVTVQHYEGVTESEDESRGGLFEFDGQWWRWSMGSES